MKSSFLYQDVHNTIQLAMYDNTSRDINGGKIFISAVEKLLSFFAIQIYQVTIRLFLSVSFLAVSH